MHFGLMLDHQTVNSTLFLYKSCMAYPFQSLEYCFITSSIINSSFYCHTTSTNPTMPSIIFKKFFTTAHKTKNTPSAWHKSAIFHLISVEINKPHYSGVCYANDITVARVKGLALHILTERYNHLPYLLLILFASTSQFFIPLLANKAYTEPYINIHNKHTHLCGCLALQSP